MEYKFITLTDNLPLVEMSENTKENVKTIQMLRKEVKKLKELNTKEEKKEIVINIETKSKETTKEIDNEENIIDEIEHYYSLIKNIDYNSDENIVTKIKDLLPSVKNKNYFTIIYGITSLILKELNEIKDLIEIEKDNLTKEELQYFREEISENFKKIQIISSVNKDEDVIENKETKRNKLVFMETSSGNIYALEDLDEKRIPKEYHDSFYELFTSIQDGTFKNVKDLNKSNREVSGVSEVRGFKTRIVYDRIGHDTYAIIAVFIKKSDNDTGYANFLKHRIAVYRAQKNKLINNCQNSDFMKEQELILEKIYNQIENKDNENIITKGLK